MEFEIISNAATAGAMVCLSMFGPSSLKKAFILIKTDPVSAVLTLRRVLTLRPVT